MQEQKRNLRTLPTAASPSSTSLTLLLGLGCAAVLSAIMLVDGRDYCSDGEHLRSAWVGRVGLGRGGVSTTVAVETQALCDAEWNEQCSRT